MKHQPVLHTQDSIYVPRRTARALLALLCLAVIALALALWIGAPPGVALAAPLYVCTSDPNPATACGGQPGIRVPSYLCQPTCQSYAAFCVRCVPPDPVCAGGSCATRAPGRR